jgi:hypothetical protein
MSFGFGMMSTPKLIVPCEVNIAHSPQQPPRCARHERPTTRCPPASFPMPEQTTKSNSQQTSIA